MSTTRKERAFMRKLLRLYEQRKDYAFVGEEAAMAESLLRRGYLDQSAFTVMDAGVSKN